MNCSSSRSYYVFEVYIKDNTNIKGFYVEKICGISYVDVCQHYGKRNLPILMIKAIHPITIV